MAEKAKAYFRDFTALLVHHGTKEPSARSALGRLRKLYGDEVVYETYHQHAALLELKAGGAFEYFVGILKGVKAEQESRAAAQTESRTKDELYEAHLHEQSDFWTGLGKKETLAKAPVKL